MVKTFVSLCVSAVIFSVSHRLGIYLWCLTLRGGIWASANKRPSENCLSFTKEIFPDINLFDYKTMARFLKYYILLLMG